MEKLKNLNSGLGQVCLALGREYQKQATSDLELSFYIPPSFQSSFGDQFQYVKSKKLHRLFGIKNQKYDVWHCIHQDSKYLPRTKETKLILTIHDLNFLEKYQGMKCSLKLRKLQKRVDRAQVITVISKFTEMQVREHLKLEGKPVVVIPNGNSLDISRVPEKPKFMDQETFLFSIGSISQKKNFHVLLPLLNANPELHLVLAGDLDPEPAYVSELLKVAQTLGVSNRLHLPGPVNHDQKLWLYQHAQAFLFPSLSEGFGLPVVEAMSVGKPVFLSRLTSLPEIGGNEAHYFDSFEPEQMQSVFKNGMLTFDAGKAQRSIVWASQFSWDQAASAYLALYRE